MKVLFVDDNRIHHLAFSAFLTETNYEISFAQTAELALSLWVKHGHEVVITSMRLPAMNGVELIKRIRAKGSERPTYVIALSSEEDRDMLEEGLVEGADDYLIKPFQKSDLMLRLKAAERIHGAIDHQLVIFALAELTEARDMNTGEHTQRIGEYAKTLALKLKLLPKYAPLMPTNFVENLALSSALHDIGKVGIEDEVLKKPGKYTMLDRKKMERHPLIGYDTIESIRRRYPHVSFLQMAGEIARWHHERVDGKGYPDRLMGEQIPLSAKIVSVADVYDALVSERPYKKAMSHDTARDYIVAHAGSQFDPEVVRAFLACEHEFQSISSRA